MSLVAIVGRPNVGKSTLFNRLVGMRQAIVDETAGVTRDRHYGKCEWCGTEFSVVDPGGYTSTSDDIFEEEIRKQVVLAIEEADVILFMTEASTGITDYDAEIADLLRKSGKPVVLAVNKVDSGEKMYDTYQFYSLGLGDVWSISSANGSGTGDLLDEIVRRLPADASAENDHPELPSALDLLLLYYKKRPDLFEQFYSIYAQQFEVNLDSPRLEYFTQRAVVKNLCEAVNATPEDMNL